jgi:transcriptional regulator with XRE-family HTH domain
MTLPESWRKVGNRIRDLRKANRLTLKQLSRGCDLSANTISLVERGAVAPTIETLCKIASALGVSPGSLFLDACTPQVVLQRAIKTSHETEAVERVLQRLVFASSQGATCQPLSQMTRIASAAEEPCSANRLSIICLCGQIELEIDGQSYGLEPGDNLTFNGDAFHRLRNPGNLTGSAVLILPANIFPEVEKGA